MPSGLTTRTTSGRFFSESTVALTAFLFFEAVSFPSLLSSTTGLVPKARSGNFCWSRSWARFESVPGSDRLSLFCSPTARATRISRTAATTHAKITGQW